MFLSFLFWILFLVWLVSCAILVLVILNQEPKGGGVGAMFGQGSFMGEALGVSGITATLRRITTTAASAFMVLSILLAVMAPTVYRRATGIVPPPVVQAEGEPVTMTLEPEAETVSAEPIAAEAAAPAPDAAPAPAEPATSTTPAANPGE